MKTTSQFPKIHANLSKDALDKANGCYHKFFNTACVEEVSPTYAQSLIK